MKTIKDLAKDALAVQDACNLSGVVHAFSRVVTELRELIPGIGTDDLNNHPICRLYADKIAHLTGTQSFENENVFDAYDWADRRVKEST